MRVSKKWLSGLVVVCLVAVFAEAAAPAVKKLAVVTSTSSPLQDVAIANLVKLCNGTQKTWPNGETFTLVIEDPGEPEMGVAVKKLLGTTADNAKAVIAKLNGTRQIVKIVASDEELLETVVATPGSIGIVDLYAVNSAVKVLKIDGKLPFDLDYELKSN
jgi:ABC-type phosphate transport system substrate-binding protein